MAALLISPRFFLAILVVLASLMNLESMSSFQKYLNYTFLRIFIACCQVASVVSDSVRPHGLQPTRLLRPWDSPGKNTGLG